MRIRVSLLILALAFISCSCSPISQNELIQTAISLTQTAQPTSTTTPRPSPTLPKNTPTSTPIPISLSEIDLSQVLLTPDLLTFAGDFVPGDWTGRIQSELIINEFLSHSKDVRKRLIIDDDAIVNSAQTGWHAEKQFMLTVEESIWITKGDRHSQRLLQAFQDAYLTDPFYGGTVKENHQFSEEDIDIWLIKGSFQGSEVSVVSISSGELVIIINFVGTKLLVEEDILEVAKASINNFLTYQHP